MQKLYELCNWCSYLFLISISVMLSSISCLIVFGLIPAFRAGIYTIDRIIELGELLSARKVIKIFWSRFYYESKRCLLGSIRLLLIIIVEFVLIRISLLSFSDNQIFLVIGFYLFLLIAFMLISEILKDGYSIKATTNFIILNFAKVICSTILMVMFIAISFFSSLPIWFFSIGLVCYSLRFINQI